MRQSLGGGDDDGSGIKDLVTCHATATILQTKMPMDNQNLKLL